MCFSGEERREYVIQNEKSNHLKKNIIFGYKERQYLN
jgi:hypothetical protein